MCIRDSYITVKYHKLSQREQRATASVGKHTRHHLASRYSPGRDLPPLLTGDNVRIQPTSSTQRQWKEGTVKEELPNRSYVVKTNDGSTYRRNRRHLRKTRPSMHSQPTNLNTKPLRHYVREEDTPQQPPEQDEDRTVPKPAQESTAEHYQTRSGRVSKPPDRYGGNC